MEIAFQLGRRERRRRRRRPTYYSEGGENRTILVLCPVRSCARGRKSHAQNERKAVFEREGGMEGRERLVVQKSSLSMHILLLLAWIGEAEERERGAMGKSLPREGGEAKGLLV